jgi:hypothetical protein
MVFAAEGRARREKEQGARTHVTHRVQKIDEGGACLIPQHRQVGPAGLWRRRRRHGRAAFLFFFLMPREKMKSECPHRRCFRARVFIKHTPITSAVRLPLLRRATVVVLAPPARRAPASLVHHRAALARRRRCCCSPRAVADDDDEGAMGESQVRALPMARRVR